MFYICSKKVAVPVVRRVTANQDYSGSVYERRGCTQGKLTLSANTTLHFYEYYQYYQFYYALLSHIVALLDTHYRNSACHLSPRGI